ncbi:hypothetical protein HELRODRAFT_181657 [Helobdella robusta]|uniref:Uncharacterized protein n=1 Tax=Helobdella robusta TaxID=6412 RepID=T1FH75_HELRO|nr:hypothetical protein HELRODRAFT_181657 [Helobdella robusta]ESN92187.1 hypothetical protein HELRODRAFT_181657 [Helobdella robusta]
MEDAGVYVCSVIVRQHQQQHPQQQHPQQHPQQQQQQHPRDYIACITQLSVVTITLSANRNAVNVGQPIILRCQVFGSYGNLDNNIIPSNDIHNNNNIIINNNKQKAFPTKKLLQ